ncbi:WecB/TagA/CpsF family glycosyltransferase [Leptolyngbya boryana CZ1]|uniref:WecB/TagA/CpsF family glycosyltransferase n=1 Tax=Leptolyngbya boryana CZ1 TaxID=3060204 RepID=A0AA97AVR7_LEPBY|nr:WecB/TagA/CpsF family glycosyltransferase [Leptolyngbya boryana]WNZ47635.1 WecB/TagA/CpsF family glycosyltransferase [Leptolyngbya boryana CZ1]
MINYGKHSVLGINVHAVDYDYAISQIVAAAKRRQPYAVSALAVHGVMTGLLDPIHARRLNGLDLVVPDGQPVRWALRLLHRKALPDRVYGPNLTLKTVEALAKEELSVYLYGSRMEVLDSLSANLQRRFPGLIVAGKEPSKFRRLSQEERMQVINRIRASGANAVLLGLGCPRQEVWAYEYRDQVKIPILAVGAAFDFFAGSLPQAPKVMQDYGLEWLFRLIQEPKRLWQRYLVLNPLYLWHLFLQYRGLRQYPTVLPRGDEHIESFG